MNREFNDELLSAYLDGQLSAGDAAAVEAQLATSRESRQLLDELRTISQHVQGLPRHKADGDFADRVVRAAIAAKAQSNGQVQLAPAPNNDSHKARRGARLPVVLAGVTAVAAAVALLLWGPWIGGAGVPGPGPEIVNNQNSLPLTPATSAAEAALAQLRQAIPQEGEAVVIRLRLAPGESATEAVNRALAAAGIAERLSSDPTTGANEFGYVYRQQLAARFGGEQPGVPNTALAEGTVAVADAVFVEASWQTLEKAVQALAATDQPLELSPLAHIAATLPTPEQIAEMIAAGEAPASAAGPPPANFAQRLPVSSFRLDKAAEQFAAAAAPASIDGQRKVRILLLVEQAQ